MVNKPILDIDISAAEEKMKRLKDLYTSYETAIKKMPGQWGDASNAMGLANLQLLRIAESVEKMAGGMTVAAAEQDKLKQKADDTLLAWMGMGKRTSEVGKNIAGITLNLAKWAGLIGVGLLGVGAGSLFGLDRLAYSAASSRRSAQGLGVSIGEQKAFGVNYGRFLDPDSVLSSVADAKSDNSKRWAFGALGINGQDNKDPAQLAVEAVRLVKQQFVGANQNNQFAAAHGMLEIFGSMDNLRRIAAGNVGYAEGGYKRDVGNLAISDKTAENWQNFTVKLGEAGEKISNVFINGLVKLEPQLEKLTESFLNVVTALADSPKVKELISDLVTGLETFANWLLPRTQGTTPWTAPQTSSSAPEMLTGLPGFLGMKMSLPAPDAALMHSLMMAESSGDPNAQSLTGVRGLYQVTKGAWKDFGHPFANRLDPAEQAYTAKRMMATMLNRYNGDVEKALIAYHEGSGFVDANVRGHLDWKAGLSKEDTAYLNKILSPTVRISVNNNTGGNAVVNGVQAAAGTY